MGETAILRDEVNAITSALFALEDFVNDLAKRVRKLEERINGKMPQV